MAISFQYNKTSLQHLNKQLKVRIRALPILKNKESALRAEVKRAKDVAEKLDHELATIYEKYYEGVRLWGEFDKNLISIAEIRTTSRKIAGVRIPEFEDVIFETKPFLVFTNPKWLSDGIRIIRELTLTSIKRDIYIQKMELLDFARKKTTQKVNLYEKVQIPGYEEAIMKIKRFLEDEENLSKSAQKIVKTRQAAAIAEEEAA
ncbi:MAG: V-type ATP synthase subunit D [Bacteroidales bacterium]|nr:V-type ATP synthase subunit D [Bacteroidales bacterium]